MSDQSELWEHVPKGFDLSQPNRITKHYAKKYDICENNHRDALTSVLANPSHHAKQRQQKRIYEALAHAKEASCERLEVVTGISHQSCSARISELLRDNRIKIVGRGTTISGKPCRLYRIV